MDSELSGEVIQGVKAAAGIEVFLILAVAALHFTVVARRVGSDELVADTQVGGGGLKQSREIPLAVGESVRFLYKGIIINHNKKLSQPTLKRRFFKKKAAFFSWPGLGKEWC